MEPDPDDLNVFDAALNEHVQDDESDNMEDNDEEDEEEDNNLAEQTPRIKRLRNRKFRDVPDTFRQEANTVFASFEEFFRTDSRAPEMTETMRRLAILTQDALEEYLGLHRDPADDISLKTHGSPKIHHLFEKFDAIMGPQTSEFFEKMCRHYIIGGHQDSDLQYYATVVLYGTVQSLSASSEEGAEGMMVFFLPDDIFHPLLHMIRVDHPSPHPSFRLPTSHVREIRALLCGIFGSCFEKVVVNDFRAKLFDVRAIIPGHVTRLREYLSTFKVSTSQESLAEPTTSKTLPTTPTNARSSMKRKLDRSKSFHESSSSAQKKKKSRTGFHTPQEFRDIDENSTASSWAEYERLQIGEVAQNFRAIPMDENLEIRLILDLLVGLATLSEFQATFFELDALGLCAAFLDCRKQLNVRILGQAIHLLANLLLTSRFVTKFMDMPGRLSQLIRLPYPSIPSVFAVKALRNIVNSSEFALETIVKFPDLVTSTTSFMTEAGLKSGHESARKWSAEFFSKVLEYRVFLDAFDEPKIDGLRVLLNVAKGDLERELSTDEQIESASSALNSAFSALICYFTTDMVIKMEYYRQDSIRRCREAGKEPPTELKFSRPNFSKAIHLEKDELDEVRDYMLNHIPLWRSSRDRVQRFVKLEGIQRLLQILEREKVDHVTLRDFTLVSYHRAALEVLEKCVLSKCAQDVIASYCTTDKVYPFTGFGLLMKLSVKYIHNVADVMNLALHVLANCVYGLRTGLTPEEQEVQKLNKKGPRAFYNDAAHFESIVTIFRQHNGIKDMIRILTDALEADREGHRALACKVLAGMAKSAPCRQILRELSFFRTGEVQVLMREPLSVGHADYIKFEKYATELLEIIYETKLRIPIPVNLAEHVAKQSILNRSRITFSSQEIDTLLFGHLQARGLTKTAATLAEEVGLQSSSRSTMTSTPMKNGVRSSISPGPVRTPVRQPILDNGFKVPVSPNRANEIETNYMIDATDTPTAIGGVPNLAGVIANNFRAQHAQCEHPIAFCPPFSLKKKHRCPPVIRQHEPLHNVHIRGLFRSDTPFGDLCFRSLDRNYIFSKLSQIGSFEASDQHFDPHEGTRSAAFVGAKQEHVVMGAGDGFILGFDLSGDEQKILYNTPSFYKTCHDYECETMHLKTLTRTPDRFLSCCSAETSSLWKHNGDGISLLHQYEDISYMDMPFWHDNIAVGELNNDAFILDLETGEHTLNFGHTQLQARYLWNQPSFHPTDDLITHQGLLFDARTGRLVHKFDQFEKYTSNGFFHPVGNLIIIDSEVWDLRNFRLVTSVPALHKSSLKFSQSGHIIFALRYHDEPEDEVDAKFPGVLTTINAGDFSTIAGFDLKRKFEALTLDSLDNNVILAEPYNDTTGTLGRLFRIGVGKGIPELEEEIEEEEIYASSDEEEDVGDEYDEMDDMLDWDEEDGLEDDAEIPEEEHSSDEWTTEEENGDEAAEGDDDNDDFFYGIN